MRAPLIMMHDSLNRIVCRVLVLQSFFVLVQSEILDGEFMKRGGLNQVQYLDNLRLDLNPVAPTHVFELRKRSAEEHPLPTLRLHLTAFGEAIALDLWPNHDLLHPDIEIHVNGQVNVDLGATHVYDGIVLPADGDSTRKRGWARITFHGPPAEEQPFEGVFTLDGELVNIKLDDHYIRTRRPSDIPLVKRSEQGNRQIIYKESDRTAPSHSVNEEEAELSCGSDHLHANKHYLAEMEQHHALSGHKSRRAAAGCPTAKKILYMGVAADCTYVSYYGGQVNALNQILKNWNQASKLYEDLFNIALGIIKVSMFETCDLADDKNWNQPCSTGYQISSRLSDFSNWRGKQNADAGLWHLMTRCSSGATVGVAWLGKVCSVTAERKSTGEYVSGTGVTSVDVNEWMVVAHEIGHNFGALHDCSASLCGCVDSANPLTKCSCCKCDQCDCGGQYIMNPTANAKQTTFSPCSQRSICSISTSSCFQDPGARSTLSEGICGNGVKEGKEECDCGPASGDDCKIDACCDGETCKLKPGAACSDRNDACCSKCQLLPANTVCRPSRGVCDTEEKCSGSSGTCPIDTYVEDLSPCTVNGTFNGKCASGDCTSRDYQCIQRSPVAGTVRECAGFTDQCTIVCATDQVGTCVQLGLYYQEGTSCGFGGKCVRGECQSSGDQKFLGWIMAHLATFISIVVFVLTFLIGSVWHVSKRWFASKRQQRQLQSSSSLDSLVSHPASSYLLSNSTKHLTLKQQKSMQLARSNDHLLPEYPPVSSSSSSLPSHTPRADEKKNQKGKDKQPNMVMLTGNLMGEQQPALEGNKRRPTKLIVDVTGPVAPSVDLSSAQLSAGVYSPTKDSIRSRRHDFAKETKK